MFSEKLVRQRIRLRVWFSLPTAGHLYMASTPGPLDATRRFAGRAARTQGALLCHRAAALPRLREPGAPRAA
eukprot:5751411-Heterocapsa_arctica.AAC.1